MYYKSITAAAVVAVGGLGFIFLGDITDKDVIAANAFDRAASAEPLSAGDLVRVPDQGRMTRICNAEVAEADLETDHRSEFYFNRVARFAGWSAELANRIGLLDGEKVAAITGAGITFVGRSSALKGSRYSYTNPQACECAIARTLARGDKVCAISASLIETGEAVRNADGARMFRPVRRTVAVALRDHVIRLPRETFEGCKVDFTPAANLVQQLSCATGPSRLPPDVKLRSYLNLIKSERIEASAARLN